MPQVTAYRILISGFLILGLGACEGFKSPAIGQNSLDNVSALSSSAPIQPQTHTQVTAATSTVCTPNSEQTCSANNGIGVQMCSSDGSGWGTCQLTDCNSGLYYADGVCWQVSLSASPATVVAGGATTLNWNTPGASFCTVSANGYTLWNSTTGGVSTSTYGALMNDTSYRLACAMNDGSIQSGQVTVRVPVPQPNSQFTFNAMRGGNIFDGNYWFSNTPSLAPIAARLNQNFTRLNVNVGQAVLNGTVPDLLNQLGLSMDALAANGQKVILTFGGYIEYDQECASNASFLEIKTAAAEILQRFRSHPALYAWELMNEAYSTQDDGYGCTHSETNQAVHEMYKLVRFFSPNTPTTVSEAWYWWYLPTWLDVSSFSSFHIYPQAQSPLTTTQISAAQSTLSRAIDSAGAAVSPNALVLGEFGASNSALNPTDSATFYQSMYDVLKSENIGSFYWDLSFYDSASTVIHVDGSLTPAAQVIQSNLTP